MSLKTGSKPLPKKRPTTKEIAEILGVSRSTVIRALANDPKIKGETVARVFDVADRIGYKKNSIAGSLRSGKTGIVGCVVPNVYNPSYADEVTYVSSYLNSKGLSMLLGVTDDHEETERKYISTFMNYRVEGVLLSNSRTGFFKDYIFELKNSDIPVVILGDGSTVGIESVMADDEAGAFELMSFLKQNGYRRISFLYDPGFGIDARLEGYKRGLLENGLMYDPDYIVSCTNLLQVRQMVMQMLELPTPPEVIFAANDYLAMEVLHVLSIMQIRVPDDIGVVGFDNNSWARESLPPLTTVDLGYEQAVHRALDRLLLRINGRSGEETGGLHLKLPPRLCIRETTRILKSDTG